MIDMFCERNLVIEIAPNLSDLKVYKRYSLDYHVHSSFGIYATILVMKFRFLTLVNPTYLDNSVS